MTSTTTATVDDWDAPSASASTPVTTRAAAPVRDDWEDDEDDETDAPTEEANQRLWNDANTKPAAPMPTVVSSSTPPPGAFQPAMRILKRPGPVASAAHGGAAPSGGEEEEFREREARYQAARERIFGAGRGQAQAQARASTVLRNPRGGSAEKGFARVEGRG
ncbi:hypothetical protein IW261DRAFT_1458042 [Armillaria novae-zelandiae]|uniref:SUZ domain-containing protein n=1 Tax=Armillaria novae-zelandiae TaxID=153914 RepID=A0AA39PI09_9AGAR|nr:hypothetical protein IW261DRAFT_1458042 [Armillaria novae-zelandiae]